MEKAFWLLGRRSQTANNDTNSFAPQHSHEHYVCSKDWGRACGYSGSGCGSVEGVTRNVTLSTFQRAEEEGTEGKGGGDEDVSAWGEQEEITQVRGTIHQSSRFKLASYLASYAFALRRLHNGFCVVLYCVSCM